MWTRYCPYFKVQLCKYTHKLTKPYPGIILASGFTLYCHMINATSHSYSSAAVLYSPVPPLTPLSSPVPRLGESMPKQEGNK